MNLPEHLILHQFELGPLNNFLYIIGDQRSKEVAVVDPAWDVNFLIKQIQEKDYKVSAVFLTHGHPDHVNGLDEFVDHYDVPIYMSEDEAPFYKPQHPNFVDTTNHQILKTGAIEWECLFTPGHAPGCQCFKHENVLIAGDTIFIDGCGRCDLPGSDPEQQYHSLYDVLMPLDDATLLFTGHNYGPAAVATLGEQKQTNPYLTCQDKNEFLVRRMGIQI